MTTTAPTSAPAADARALGLAHYAARAVLEHVHTMAVRPKVVLMTGFHEAVPPGQLAPYVQACLTKPFSARILVARVATILRRAIEASKHYGDNSVRVGSLELDLLSQEVRYDGREVRLTPLEFFLGDHEPLPEDLGSWKETGAAVDVAIDALSNVAAPASARGKLNLTIVLSPNNCSDRKRRQISRS